MRQLPIASRRYKSDQENLDGGYAAGGCRWQRAIADGRVMEMLSEHTLLGWLEGYLLTGRHGFFHTYEAFSHVIDSMFNQHAKWLDISKNHVPWRASVASENILLSSTVWRQDHNGFSHQDPGFIDLVTNKSSSVTRVYLPPDANTLLSVADHCLRSTDYINVIVADKQKHCSSRRLTKRSCIAQRCRNLGAGEHGCRRGARRGLGLCGDVATLEASPRLRSSASAHRTSSCGSSMSSICLSSSRPPNTHTVNESRVRQPLHHRQADHLNSTAIPG